MHTHNTDCRILLHLFIGSHAQSLPHQNIFVCLCSSEYLPCSCTITHDGRRPALRLRTHQTREALSRENRNIAPGEAFRLKFGLAVSLEALLATLELDMFQLEARPANTDNQPALEYKLVSTKRAALLSVYGSAVGWELSAVPENRAVLWIMAHPYLFSRFPSRSILRMNSGSTRRCKWYLRSLLHMIVDAVEFVACCGARRML